jgi:hypothetical protein
MGKMLDKNFFEAARWKKICASLGMASLMTLCAVRCDSDNPAAPQPTEALTLVTPKGGENFSINDTVPVKWFINQDSLNASNINSYLKQYSPDSGKNWYDMAVKPGSAKTDSNKYQITWLVVDTSTFNNTTQANFTKADYLNRGILVQVISYPPHSKIGSSGFIHFHE